jgi:hypothetical protein
VNLSFKIVKNSLNVNSIAMLLMFFDLTFLVSINLIMYIGTTIFKR